MGSGNHTLIECIRIYACIWFCAYAYGCVWVCVFLVNYIRQAFQNHIRINVRNVIGIGVVSCAQRKCCWRRLKWPASVSHGGLFLAQWHRQNATIIMNEHYRHIAYTVWHRSDDARWRGWFESIMFLLLAFRWRNCVAVKFPRRHCLMFRSETNSDGVVGMIVMRCDTIFGRVLNSVYWILVASLSQHETVELECRHFSDSGFSSQSHFTKPKIENTNGFNWNCSIWNSNLSNEWNENADKCSKPKMNLLQCIYFLIW